MCAAFWRLFPAIAGVIAATLIGAHRVLSPHDYEVLAAISGLSNFFFFSQLDYFNDNTLIHPLLHTWSLGVEEQFYLFWPLLIVFAGRWYPLPAFIAGLFACALAFTLLVAGTNPQFAFYMMPFRIFEFAAGAGVLLLGPRIPPAGRLAGGAVGATLVGVGLVTVGENRLWPGVAALLPVGGTALLLWAGPTRFWTTVLGNPLFCFIGKISYALYLVHWPIIVLYRYWRVLPLSLGELGVLALASVVGALVLHVAVETPFREGRPAVSGLFRFLDVRRLPFWQKIKAPTLGLVTLATLIGAATVWTSGGFPGRVAKHRAQRSTAELSYAGDICSGDRCVIGDANSERIVYIVGDSHAGNLFYGLDTLLRELRIKGIGVTDNGCLFLFNTTRFVKGRYDKKCARNIADAFSVMGADNAPVILVGNPQGYIGQIGFVGDKEAIAFADGDFYPFIRKRLIESMKRLNAEHRPVLLVKTGYDSGIDTARCLLRPGADQADLLEKDCRPLSLEGNRAASRKADTVLDQVAQLFSGVSTIDPKRAFCDQTRCTVMKGGAFLMRDTTHLTNAGSLFLVEQLRKELLAWLGKG